ncbi:MAG: acylneuraminate cytidylyltransferase family protein [Clostridia bacterium]|nr:acylneuraminate cytidylyltransferase family protein [Clostridia bacterium]
MKRIAIIPARSGSKGVKNKNIRELCGKPMMAYTIEAALKSGKFERVIVSTESEEYARIAKSYGAEVIPRSEELAQDSTSTFAVIEDLFLHSIKEKYDYFMLLQVTSPFRTYEHVIEACDMFDARIDEMDFLMSMKRNHLPSFYVQPIEEDLTLKHFVPAKNASGRRQDYRYYCPNGALYIAKPDEYLEAKNFTGPRALAYIMSERDSVDVDEPLDFEIAEFLMAKRLKESENNV